jgi:hypothetical protein
MVPNAEDRPTSLNERLQVFPRPGIGGGFIVIRTLGLQFFLEDIKILPVLPQKENKRQENAPQNSCSEGDGARVKASEQLGFHEFLLDSIAVSVSADARS